MVRTDRCFGLFPEGFQFVDAASLQRSTQRGFNTGETVEEALIRAGEAFFGFDLAPTGHVHQGEQQIAQFLLGMTFVSCLLYTSPSPRDGLLSRMPSSA